MKKKMKKKTKRSGLLGKGKYIVQLLLAAILLEIVLNLTNLAMGWIVGGARAGQDYFLYGETVAALIASYLVVNQLKKETKEEEKKNLIQQAFFIKDYNQMFIENSSMAKVESTLEEYYVAFLRNEDMNAAGEKLRKQMDLPGSAGRQEYVNYLVYLEGLAATIYNYSMEMQNIDSLFGYRFFVAVNNPVVQEQELLPYSIHYQGIYWLHKQWSRYREILREKYGPSNNGITEREQYGIPMECEGYALKYLPGYMEITRLYERTADFTIERTEDQ